MAVMGSSLARNVARHGYRVALFNRTYSRAQQVVADHGSEGAFLPTETIEEFVASLERPPRIVIIVKASTPSGPDTAARSGLTEALR
jgi:6-phosphogluconate dehydrogenase